MELVTNFIDSSRVLEYLINNPVEFPGWEWIENLKKKLKKVLGSINSSIFETNYISSYSMFKVLRMAFFWVILLLCL